MERPGRTDSTGATASAAAAPASLERDRKGIAYRRAREEDRPQVLTVLRSANFHRIPSPEMPELDIARFFVAEVGGEIVGVAGYNLLEDGKGKTTLMAVLPRYRGLRIGERLQELRMAEMRSLGCKVAITNADLPATIDWYRRKFGYRVVGQLPKLHEFGALEIDHWTTLEVDLEAWDDGSRPALEAS